jgi:hypothetical protein
VVASALGLALAIALFCARSGQAQEGDAPGYEAEKRGPKGAENNDVPKKNDVSPGGVKYASGELIVTYVSDEARRENKLGGQPIGDGRAVLVTVSEKEIKDENERVKKVAEKKAKLEKEPFVDSVEYNQVGELAWTPDDPLFPDNGTFDRQWYLHRVNAPEGWSSVNGRGQPADAPAVGVAILDTGYDWTLSEFCTAYDGLQANPCYGGKVVDDYDFANDDSRPFDNDELSISHGTHVASVASAFTNNSVGIAGAAPYADLLIGGIVQADGAIYASDMVDGIDWAVSKGARVINISSRFTSPAPSIRDALIRADSGNALPVCAAGNDYSGTNSAYPAAYPECLTVGATNVENTKTQFSNYGPQIDVVAPGINIIGMKKLNYNPSAPYDRASGTSFSAPQVAGLAADITSRNPANTDEFVRAKIQNTATDLGATGRDDYYGYGLVNFQKAISSTAQ